MEHHEAAKNLLDWTALSATVGVFVGALPTIAALLSAVWTTLRIVEMLSGKTISQLLRGK